MSKRRYSQILFRLDFEYLSLTLYHFQFRHRHQMGTRTEGTKNRETLKYKERNSRERTNGVRTGVLD